MWVLLTLPSIVAWCGLLLSPWRSWGTTEQLHAKSSGFQNSDLDDVTVLIPARNEARVLAKTLTCLSGQGQGLRVVVVDDNSSDETADIARNASNLGVTVVQGAALSEGWSGKLWALEQGLQEVRTPLVLLLDADIALSPNMLLSMREKLKNQDLHLLSLMAELRMQSAWERLLMPAYVYFFKLLYPFKLSNRKDSKVAAAAGGCVLLRADVLKAIGGFLSLRSALIDDCTLAARVKSHGYNTWIGLTRDVHSLRAYESLSSVWRLVSRSAFTQLRYSLLLLLLVTILFALVFVIPFVAIFSEQNIVMLMGVIAVFCMYVCYIPILNFYDQNPLFVLLLPVVSMLFLSMTWTSAFSYWFGKGASWKGRHYGAVRKAESQ